MKRHVLFSPKREMPILLMCVFTFVFSLSASGVTNYTYTTEGFESTTWPTSASSTLAAVETTTGTWSVIKFAQVTSAYFAGTSSMKAGSSGTGYYIQTPYLANGAAVVSFYMYATGTSGRTIDVQYTTDGTNWTTASTISAPTTKKTWGLNSVTINNASVKYVRLANPSNSDLQFDNFTVTAATIKLTTPTVGSPSSATSTGFTANWSTVTNASGYLVNIYKGTTLVNTVTVSSGTATSSVVAGLSPDSTYTYTVTAVGDNITYSNSIESSASSSIRVLNSAASITSFVLASVSGIIDQTAKTISVTVSSSTDLTVALIPSVTVSDKASYAPSGAQLFTVGTPTTYTVTAEDGTTQSYAVSVTKSAADTVRTIKTFSLGITNEQVTISNTTSEITVIVSASSVLTGITPTYTLTSSSSTMTTLATDYSTNPATLVVTAESGQTKTYSVYVYKDTEAPQFVSSNPADSATAVSLAGNIVLTFTDNYSTAIILLNASKISLSGGTGSISSSVSGLLLTAHFSGLASTTAYTLTLLPGAIADTYGNANTDTITITFTTADGVNRTLPYYTHMTGANFALPAFISEPTMYVDSINTKATVTTQYGAYKLSPGDTLWIKSINVDSVYFNVYATGINRYYTVGSSVSSSVATGTISYYSKTGTSIELGIGYIGSSVSPADVYITNSSSSAGAIYIPFIYMNAFGETLLTEKEVWCTSTSN